MAKFAVVLFFTALAFQATFAQYLSYTKNQHQQHGDNVQGLLNQIQYVSREAITAIQHSDSEHALYSQANEFAHNLHEVAYHLQHIAHQSEEGQRQKLLEEVVKVLSEAVHQIQKGIHNEPAELKSQLKIHIQNVAAKAQKLVQVIQQEQSEHNHVGEEIQDSLDDFLTAIQQLQVRNIIENRGQEEIKNYIHTVTNQVVGAIEVVQGGDEDVAEKLVHHAHHYGHHIGDIIHKLQREVRNHNIHNEQVQNVLQKVTNNLGQIHGSLEQLGHHSQNRDDSLEQLGHHSQNRDSLEHVGHQGQGKYWQIHAVLFPTSHLVHEHQVHVPHHSQDNYQQIHGIGHNAQDSYGQIHSLDHHAQDNYQQIHSAQNNYEQIHGLGHQYGNIHGLDQHTQEIHGLGHQYQNNYEQVYGLGHQYQNNYDHIPGSPFKPAGHLGQHSQDSFDTIQPINRYYQGGIVGNKSPVVKHVVQKLESSVRGVSVQLAHLVELVEVDHTKENKSHNLEDLVYTVVAHSLVASRQLQRNVEHTIQHVNHYVNQDI